MFFCTLCTLCMRCDCARGPGGSDLVALQPAMVATIWFSTPASRVESLSRCVSCLDQERCPVLYRIQTRACTHSKERDGLVYRCCVLLRCQFCLSPTDRNFLPVSRSLRRLWYDVCSMRTPSTFRPMGESSNLKNFSSSRCGEIMRA